MSEITVKPSPLLSHLHNSYPIYGETTTYLATFPLLNSLSTSTTKYVNSFKELNRIYAPQINSFFDLIESFIVTFVFIKWVDVQFPDLKKLHLSDLTIHNLSTKVIPFIKSTYIYIRTCELINQLLRYTNTKLISLVASQSSPSVDGAAKDSSEVDKFVKISKTLLGSFKSYPSKVQTHVKEVYNDEFTKNNKNSFMALASTSNELASEISEKFQYGLKQIKTTTSSTSAAISAITANITEVAKPVVQPGAEPVVELIPEAKTTGVELTEGTNGSKSAADDSVTEITVI